MWVFRQLAFGLGCILLVFSYPPTFVGGFLRGEAERLKRWGAAK